jgi:mitogen-activated protein kinase kinase kinase
MRRHTPTLFPHPEHNVQQADDTDDAEEADWAIPRPHPFTSQSMPTSGLSHRSRIKPRTTHSVPSKSNTNITSANSPRPASRYSDLYSQFVQRYRSQPDDDGPYNDPDSHFFNRSFWELVDVGDSDDNDPSLATAASTEIVDPMTALTLDSESVQPATLEERERLEWQTMLASVLDGDVLKTEKTRIAVALESSVDEQNSTHLNIWLGIRARIHGTSEAEERKLLEESRLHTVDAVIEEILSFRVDPVGGNNATSALKQVNALMHRLDMAQSLYPSLKAFHVDKAVSLRPEFQARCDTLNTWSTVFISLRRQIALLSRWTGSDTLDVTQPNTNAEVPIGSNHSHVAEDGRTEIADGTSFVERVLKEESMQRTFEKGFLTTVHSFISIARDAQVNLSILFKEMNLPTFENELVPLISFPTKLAQAGLCVLLDHVQKLKDPDVLIIDQLTEDLKLNIGLACMLKRQYDAFLAPDPGGNWNLPQCISQDYDATILEALSILFRLIHWKFKAGMKGVYFKETDVLEAHWATFNDVSMTAPGGSLLVAEQLWYDPKFSGMSYIHVLFWTVHLRTNLWSV